MSSHEQYPLAKDASGKPIAVPPEAVAWRVARDHTGGRPRAVFDCDTGQRLRIALDATLADLIRCRLAPGCYRLESVNAEGQALSAVAFAEIPEVPTREAPPVTVADGFTCMVQLVRESMSTNVRCMEAMASAFGPVRPAAPPQPVPVEAAPRSESISPDALMQMIMTLVTKGMDMFKAAKSAEVA